MVVWEVVVLVVIEVVTVSGSDTAGLVTAPAPETLITHTSHEPAAPYECVEPVLVESLWA